MFSTRLKTGTRITKALASLVVCFILLVNQACVVTAVANETTPVEASTTPPTAPAATNTVEPPVELPPQIPSALLLDLSSATASIPGSGAAVLLTGGTLSEHGTIVGGTYFEVEHGQLLTPAQSMALSQIANTGAQQVILNGAGQAVGGMVTLTPTIGPIAELHIPVGVSLNSIGFTAATPFEVEGNAIVNGALYALQTMPHTESVLNFGNLTIGSGGLLTTALPGYAQFLPNVMESAGLTLNIANNLVNNGTIATAGTLNINAGGSIVNQSLGNLQATISAQAMNLNARSFFNSGIISATQSINLVTSNVTNSGLLQSLAADLNVRSLSDALLINNTDGLMQASGDVLMETLSTRQTFDEYGALAQLSLSGGDIASSALRLTSPNGAILVDAHRIDAPVYVNGGVAGVGTRSGDLSIAQLDLTGDPIFFAQGGNLDLSGVLPNGGTFSTSGGDFIALATGNITATGMTVDTTINAASSATNGGNIVFAAGVNFTTSGAVSPIGCSDCSSNYTILGASGDPGSIILPRLALQTAGKNITLQANSGSITVRSLTTTSDGGGNSAGAISATASGAITTDGLTTTGVNNANGGNVTLDSGTGAFTINGNIYTRSTTSTCSDCGNTGSGSAGLLAFKQAGATLTNPVVSLPGGADILVDGSSATSTSNVSLTLAAPVALDSVSTRNNGGGVAGSVNITSPGALSINYIDSGASGNTGTSGDIQLTAAGAISVQQLTATGINNGAGGDIVLDSGTAVFNSGSIFARSSSSGCHDCEGDTGAGLPGSLTFRQSGATLANPTVNFATNSRIVLDGSTVGSTPSLTFTQATTNRLGTISNRNLGGGNAGDITVYGTGDLNVGDVVTVANGSGASAGDITLIANGALDAFILHSAGFTHGNGGNITLDSSTGTLTLSGIWAKSSDVAWCSGCDDRTGNGSAGTLTVRQSGVVQANPVINFNTNSKILLDGGSGNTQALTFTLANNNQMGTISNKNVGTGNSGNILISGLSDVNLGDVVSEVRGAGRTAGSITIDANGAVRTGVLNSSGVVNANAGAILVDSSTATFTLNGAWARSADVDWCVNCLDRNGSGLPSTLTFAQNGVTLANPTVDFLPGSRILLDGASPTSTASITLTLANGNFLNAVNTLNVGTGSAGNVTIYGAGNLNVGDVITESFSSTGSAGDITLRANGSLSTQSLYAIGLNNANAGTITLDSTSATFATQSLYARSTDVSWCSNCSDRIGTGTPGLITFEQGGVLLVNPTISFAAGSRVMVDGSSAGSTQSLTFTQATADRMGVVTTINAGTGSSGNITIYGATNLNLSDVITQVYSPTAKAGDVTLTANGAIDTFTINATGLMNADGGHVLLDSSTATFKVDSIWARSSDVAWCSNCSDRTGAGLPGSLTFRQSGAVLGNPVVTIGTGSEILLDGTTAGTTPSISFTLATADDLDAISNRNVGTGSSGNITIGGLTDVNLDDVLTSVQSPTATAGNITIRAAGSVATDTLNASSLNSGNAGNITLDSATNVFETDSIWARSTSHGSCFNCSGWTGAGTPGMITFQQSGVVITNANLAIGAGSTIFLDGTTAGTTSGFSANLTTANNIGEITTFNLGTGGAGSLTLSSSPGNSITISGEVNTMSTAPGANAGSITLTSASAISVNRLLAAGLNNGNGGNITLDAAGNSFRLDDIYTRSVANNNYYDFSASTPNTGTGTGGALTFRWDGVTINNPNVVLAGGVDIYTDGANPGQTSDINLNIIGGTLGEVQTVNTFGPGARAGNITITSTAPIVAADIVAAGLNNSSGGNITLDSSANSFFIGSLYSRSTTGTDATFFTAADTRTGTGSAGIITFAQGGTALDNPRVTLAGGSQILADGTNAGQTTSLSMDLTGNPNLREIATLNLGTGTAGSVKLTTRGTLSGDEIFTSAAAGAGSIHILAGGAVSFDDINASASGTGNGGSLQIQTTGAISLGPISTLGASGGDVLLATTAGGINTGAIDASGTTTDGGSVGLASAGNISASSINTSAPQIAGNIFVSSGSTSASVGNINTSAGAGGVVGNIFLGANVAGTNGLSPTGNANIAFTRVDTQPTATPSAYLFYNTGTTANLTTDSALTITSGAVNLRPGGYTSIGTALDPVSITLDLGGDSRTLVPLLAFNNMYLDTYQANNTVGGAQPYQNNGYVAMLMSQNNINFAGSVTASPAPGGAAGPINIFAGDQVVFDQNASIGDASVANPINMFARNGLATTAGSNVSIASGGSIFISGNIDVSNLVGTGGSVVISAGTGVDGTLTINNVNTSSNSIAGDITLSAGGKLSTGDLVAAGYNNGRGGNITLNSNIGSFALGSLVTRSAQGTNVSSYTGDTGAGLPGQLVFQQFGTPLAVADVGFLNNSVILLDGTSAGSTSTITIDLTNNYPNLPIGDISTVNFGTGPAGDVTLTSCCSMLLSNIYTSAFSDAGDITIVSGGGINARSLIAAGMNNGNGGNVTVDSAFESFALGSLVTRSTTTSNPMTSDYLYDTGSGTAGQLVFRDSGVVLGYTTVDFIQNSSILVDGTNAGSTSTINLGLTGINGPPSYYLMRDVVTINLGAGTPGNITLGAPETLTLNQVMTAPGADVGNINVMANGGINTTSIWKAQNITMQACCGSNGSVLLSGDILALTPSSVVTIQADGTGSITQTSASTIIRSNEVRLSTGTGDIGTTAIWLRNDAPILQANTGGTVFLMDSQSASLNTSTAGTTFNLGAAGNILVNAGNTLTAPVVALHTTTNGAVITADSKIFASDVLSATNYVNGTIIVPVGQTAQSNIVSFRSNNIVNNGSIATFGNTGSHVGLYGMNGALNLSGTGSVSNVAAGFRVIDVYGNPGLGSTVNFNGNQTFNVPTGYINVSGLSVNTAAATTQTITGATLIAIAGNNVNFGDGSRIVSNVATNISLRPHTSSPDISIVAGSAGNFAELRTTGGAISIDGTAGGDITVSGGTLRLLGGTTTVNENGGTFTVGAGTTLQADRNVTVNLNGGSTLANSGLITTSNAAGQVTVTGNSNFSLSGAGTMSVTGGGVSNVNVVGAANTVNISGNQTILPGATGSSSLSAARVVFAPGTVLTMEGVNASLDASTIDLADGSSIVGANAATVLNVGSTGGSTTVRLNGPPATVNASITSPGAVNLRASGNTMNFSLASGATAGTLSVNGSSIGTANGPTGMSIGTGTTVAVNTSGILNFNGSSNATVSNNGTLQVGVGQTVTLTDSNAAPGTLAVSGNGNYDLGAGSALRFQDNINAASAITFAGTHTISGTGMVDVLTPNLTMSNGSAIAGSGNQILVSSPTGALNVNVSASSGAASARIGSTGGTVRFGAAAGNDVSFGFVGGATSGTLNLTGGNVDVTTTGVAGADVSVASGMSLTSVDSMAINVNNSSTGTFTNNGAVGVTGAGSALTIQNLAATNTSFDIAGNGTYGSDASGSVTVNNNGSNLNFAAGNTQTINGGGNVQLRSPTITLGDASAINATGASNVNVSSSGALTINVSGAAANVSSTIGTTNGTISLIPAAGSSLTVTHGGGSTTGTLNVNGGFVTTQTSGAGVTTITPGTTLASNDSIQMLVNGNSGYANSGTVTSTDNGGSIALRSSSNFNLGGVAGVISFTGGSSGTITVDAGVNQLTFTGSQMFTPGVAGTSRFSGATILVQPGVSETVTSGAGTIFDTANLILSNGSNIGTTGTTAIQVTNSAGDLTVSAIAPASVTTAGGAINFNPMGNLLFNGGGILTASGAAPSLSAGGNTEIGVGTTFASPNAINISIPHAASLTVNGTINSTVAAGTTSLVVSSPGTLNLAGNGTIAQAGGAATTLSGTNITLASGVLNVTGGGDVLIATPTLQFGNARLQALGASDITLSSGGADQHIIAPGAGLIGSLATGLGGSISSTVAAGRSIFFDGTGGTVAFEGADLALTANSGSINIASNVTLSSNLSINATTPIVNNAGVINAFGNLSFGSPTSLGVTGIGTLSASDINLTAGAGSVILNQSSVTGFLSATATGAVSLTSQLLNLSPRNITASGGNVDITAVGGAISFANGAVVNARNSINVTALNNINVGPVGVGAIGVTLSAGRLAAGASINSTSIDDYDLSAVTQTGGIMLTSTAGDINVGDNSSMSSRGASIGFISGNDISISGAQSFISQAGNIYLMALNDVTIGDGAQLTAVARYIPGAAPIVIAATQVQDFRGGDIAVESGEIIPNYDQYLRANFDMMRTGQNKFTTSGPIVDSSTKNMIRGGWIDYLAQAPGSITIGGTMTADGSVIYIDPTGIVTIGNVAFLASGSPLNLFIPPVPFAGGGVILTSSSSNTSGGGLAGGPGGGIDFSLPSAFGAQQLGRDASARSVPIDQNKNSIEPTTLVIPYNNTNICVPASVANYSEGEEKWSVASGNCQPFTHEDDDGSVVIGTAGTAVAKSKKDLMVKQGRLFAMAGNAPLSIETSKGRVSLPANSSAIIEQNSSKFLRVTQLSGGNATVETKGGAKSFSATPGEEVLIADEGMSDEELIPIDGIDRISVEATIKLSGVQIQKSRFNRDRLFERDMLLNCNQSCFPVRFRNKLTQMRNAPKTPNHLQAIAYVQPTAPKNDAAVSTTSIGTAIIKHNGNSVFQVETDKQLLLQSGELLVSAEDLTIIRTTEGMVALKPSTIALVSKDGNVLKVRSLYDAGVGDVQVYGAKQKLALNAGQEIVTARTYDDASRSMKKDAVGRRKITSVDLADGASLIQSEYSFLTLLSSSPVLSRVMLSTDKETVNLSDRVSRMMVMLGIVTRAHGQFQQLPKK